MTIMKTQKCTRCSGTGKTSFSIDNGVCYKCEGSGFIGGTQDQQIAAIASKEANRKFLSAIDRISKFLSGLQGLHFYELDLQNLNKKDRVRSIKVGVETALLFKTPYTKDFDNSMLSTLSKPEYYLDRGISLENRGVTITQISPEHIKVEYK